MTYSLDCGTKAETSRLFGVSLWCVNDWCKRDNLAPKEPAFHRERKMDWEALKRHVKEFPDALLRERVAHFDVHIHAIEYALKRMKLTRKKKPTLRRKKS